MIRESDSPSGARQKLVFEYDHQGRRIRKQFFTYSGGWQEQTDTIFLYDGWNLVAELNANASNARVRTYVWGSDLSGSMQGAGGVGGLLKLTYYGTSTTNAFVAYDGNWNVTALIDAANGNVCARYEYGPFAEPIRCSGPLSKLNPIRFSTKYSDTEPGFLYYGYRYYNPSTGRWLSRDRIEEEGGLNLYGMLDGDPINYVDLYGLAGEPTTLPLKRPIPESERGCCDEAAVKRGEDELKKRYKKATDEAKTLGLNPASPPPWGSGPATCKNSSQDVLEYLVPTPACWQCYLEERNYYSPAEDPADDRLDHQVVICVGYSTSGSKKEIIFDWWGDTKHGDNQSGGPPDKFRKKYRYPQKITENPYWTRCSDGNPNKTPPPCSGWQCSRPPVYQ